MQVRTWFVHSVFNLSLRPAQFVTNPGGIELQAVMYQEKCIVGYRLPGEKCERKRLFQHRIATGTDAPPEFL